MPRCDRLAEILCRRHVYSKFLSESRNPMSEYVSFASLRWARGHLVLAEIWWWYWSLWFRGFVAVFKWFWLACFGF